MRRNDEQSIYSKMWFFMDWQLQTIMCMSVVLKPKIINTQINRALLYISIITQTPPPPTPQEKEEEGEAQ